MQIMHAIRKVLLVNHKENIAQHDRGLKPSVLSNYESNEQHLLNYLLYCCIRITLNPFSA